MKVVVKYLWGVVLSVWLAAVMAALGDTAFSLVTGNYLVGGFGATADYFSQNAVVNVLPVAGIAAAALLVAVVTRAVSKKRYPAEGRLVSFCFIPASIVVLIISLALGINKRFLPGFYEFTSVAVNVGLVVLGGFLTFLIYRSSRKVRAPGFLKGTRVSGYAIAGLGLLIVVFDFAAGAGGDRVRGGNELSGPNVIIITIDALRQDKVDVYGKSAGLTPNIDDFASRSTVFRNACTQSPWTIPSMYTMHSGRYPSVHGAQIDRGGHPDLIMLAEVLKGYGYDTEAYVANYILFGELGYSRGFDRYEEYGEVSQLRHLKKSSMYKIFEKVNERIIDRSGSDSNAWLTGKIIGSLRKDRERPLFLWAHYLDPHTPLIPPRDYIDAEEGEKDELLAYGVTSTGYNEDMKPEDKDKITLLYEAELRYVDYQVGRVFEVMEEEGYLDDSVVIITADHGEECFEHGHYGHGHSHYDAVISVPLIIYVPERKEKRFSDHPAGLIDLYPTILDYLGIEDEYGLSGRSLLPGIEGTEDNPDKPGRLIFIDGIRDDIHMKSVRDDKYTLTRTGRGDYDYIMVDNIIGIGPDDIVNEPDSVTYNRFKKELDDFGESVDEERAALGGNAEDVILDEGQKDKIEGLGYL